MKTANKKQAVPGKKAPGKNLGGRPKGSRSKATAAIKDHVLQLMASGMELPLDFLLRTMRLREPFHREGESSLDFSTRYQAWDRRTLAAAQAAAPFCHAKLASVEHTGKDGGPINHHLTIEIVG